MGPALFWILVVACLFGSSIDMAVAQTPVPDCIARDIILRPIPETHTPPPYPVDSVTNHEEGIVLVEVRIRQDGQVDEAKLVISSGFSSLDEAARSWIQRMWRWQPLPEHCTVATRISVKWDMSLLKYTTGTPYGQPSPHPSPGYDADAITRMLMDHH